MNKMSAKLVTKKMHQICFNINERRGNSIRADKTLMETNGWRGGRRLGNLFVGGKKEQKSSFNQKHRVGKLRVNLSASEVGWLRESPNAETKV